MLMTSFSENSGMSESDPRHQEVISWLAEQGHSPDQIEKILAKLQEYDDKTMHESLFDSISDGKFDISSIIQEALEQED